MELVMNTFKNILMSFVIDLIKDFGKDNYSIDF